MNLTDRIETLKQALEVSRSLFEGCRDCHRDPGLERATGEGVADLAEAGIRRINKVLVHLDAQARADILSGAPGSAEGSR